MNLLELCEPLFQYVCILNRAGRKGGNVEYNTVRSKLKVLFEDLKSRAVSEPLLNPQYKKMEQALVFFVDSMIADSKLPFAKKWDQERLAYSFNELAGDEKFFDLFDETLKEQGDEASERLSVYYTCIGLGFSGWYSGQPEYLRKKMLEVAPRIRHLIDADRAGRVSPEAYLHVDSRDLVEPPNSKMIVILIIFLVFMLTTLAANFFLFQQASQELTSSLSEIIAHDKELPPSGGN